jgi:hypothetical protein
VPGAEVNCPSALRVGRQHPGYLETEGREMGRPHGPFVFGEKRGEGNRLGAGTNLRGRAGVWLSMSRSFVVFAAAMLLTVGVQGAPAGGPHTARAHGSAWARPGLRGTQARLMAERGAQVVAARNLLARQQGGRRHVAPGYRHIRGVVRGYYYSPAKYLPDGRAVVIVRQRPGW